jgi:threonylcarbamoyladenosine tRNA methylthiotransferase MtaB
MGRPYRARDLGDRIQAFARALPDLAVGLDVIVGFPGETDADFDDTRAFVASLPLSYLHVFPFSARPGTAAADLPDAPAHEVTVARARILRDLSVTRREAHARTRVGRTVEVVDIGARRGGIVESLAGDYTRVFRHDPAGPRAGRFPLCIALARGAHAWSGPSSQPSEFP